MMADPKERIVCLAPTTSIAFANLYALNSCATSALIFYDGMKLEHCDLKIGTVVIN